MNLDRRTVLKSGAAAALTGGPFAGFVAQAAQAAAATGGADRAGLTYPNDVELLPVPDQRDGKVRLHLPEGFSYRSFHDTETPVTLDDGTTLPGRHDGMGAFDGPGETVVLVRNHEVNGPVGAFGPDTPYDAAAGGGTTTIRVTKHGQVLSAYTSLNGTMMNCSGGVMPWGSWMTCEETVNGPDVGPDFTGQSNASLQKPHGYVFEVPAGGWAEREPITRAGRFAHESVAYDPYSKALYLSEDNFAFPSGFYRYTPKTDPMKRGRLDNQGVLHMLAVKGRPNRHLEGQQEVGRTYPVQWVRIDEPDKVFPYSPSEEPPTSNNTALTFVGNQGRAKGAALFSRLEGTIYDGGIIYFTSTQGGGARETAASDSANGFGNGFGQVWGYDPRERTLTCVYQSPDKDTLDFPDNITTSPRGTLVLCEDSTGDNYLRGLSPSGKLWDIALNRLRGAADEDRSGDEFAGSTFSPDGRTLFVNIQAGKGMSFAIWGPWRSIGV